MTQKLIFLFLPFPGKCNKAKSAVGPAINNEKDCIAAKLEEGSEVISGRGLQKRPFEIGTKIWQKHFQFSGFSQG